jgi:hypothetical protein
MIVVTGVKSTQITGSTSSQKSKKEETGHELGITFVD